MAVNAGLHENAWNGDRQALLLQQRVRDITAKIPNVILAESPTLQVSVLLWANSDQSIDVPGHSNERFGAIQNCGFPWRNYGK